MLDEHVIDSFYSRFHARTPKSLSYIHWILDFTVNNGTPQFLLMYVHVLINFERKAKERKWKNKLKRRDQLGHYEYEHRRLTAFEIHGWDSIHWFSYLKNDGVRLTDALTASRSEWIWRNNVVLCIFVDIPQMSSVQQPYHADLSPRFHCLSCEHRLRDPVKLECIHRYCRSCFIGMKT